MLQGIENWADPICKSCCMHIQKDGGFLQEANTDGTYMFNLDGLFPKLCLLAQELGEDGRSQLLCAAGLSSSFINGDSHP